jgi:hypothetical protein
MSHDHDPAHDVDRGSGSGSGSDSGSGSGSASGTGAGLSPLQTEFEFTLPRGYVDDDGTLHREGTMRLATAADEILPLKDPRVGANESYLTVILLSRVLTRLGGVDDVTTHVVENLFVSDLAYLQELYERVNARGADVVDTVCPDCGEQFEATVEPGSPGPALARERREGADDAGDADGGSSPDSGPETVPTESGAGTAAQDRTAGAAGGSPIRVGEPRTGDRDDRGVGSGNPDTQPDAGPEREP